MTITRFVFVVLALYIFSLGISIIIINRDIVLFGVGVIFLSIIIFSAIFAAFIVILAIAYAVIKKPTIEEGNYGIDRIKGKGE